MKFSSISSHRQLYSSTRTIFVFLQIALLFILIAIPSTASASSSYKSLDTPPDQNVARAGVSVVRLVASYTTGAGKAGQPTVGVQCTGLGVLVASWPQQGNDPNTWILTDGSLANGNLTKNAGTVTCGNLNTSGMMLSSLQVFLSTSYNPGAAADPIPLTTGLQNGIICQNTNDCSKGATLLAFNATPLFPYIDLPTVTSASATSTPAKGNIRPLGTPLGLTQNATSSDVPTPGNNNIQHNPTYGQQAATYLTPHLIAANNVNIEPGTPLVDADGSLVSMHLNANSALAPTDIHSFLQSQSALRSIPQNLVHDNWNTGITNFYQHNYTQALRAFQQVFQTNRQFQGASDFALLAQQDMSNPTTHSTPVGGFKIQNYFLPYWLLSIFGLFLLALLLLITTLLFGRNHQRPIISSPKRVYSTLIVTIWIIVFFFASYSWPLFLLGVILSVLMGAFVMKGGRTSPLLFLSPFITIFIYHSFSAFFSTICLVIIADLSRRAFSTTSNNISGLQNTQQKIATLLHPGKIEPKQPVPTISSIVSDPLPTPPIAPGHYQPPARNVNKIEPEQPIPTTSSIGQDKLSTPPITPPPNQPPISHCPRCHESVRPGARFCPNCRLPLSQETPQPAQNKPSPPLTNISMPTHATTSPVPPWWQESMPPASMERPQNNQPKPQASKSESHNIEISPNKPGRTGQRLGSYRLIRPLGHGGFADVYLGEHVFLHRQAAIKVLQVQLTPRAIKDFLAEARTIAGLEHPHIIHILDFGMEGKELDPDRSMQDVTGSTPFLIMDYAPRGTLRNRHPKDTRLPLTTIVPYIQQIASALQYAHERKLIHRDVKPENMLIGQNNDILLSDFGIAVVAHSDQSMSTHEMAGTLAYIAPEQIRGKPRPASDQYALGIVVYEWLSGTRPFLGTTTWEIMNQHMTVEPPRLREKVPSISPAAEEVVMKAISKDPNQRFESAQAFADALTRVASQ